MSYERIEGGSSAVQRIFYKDFFELIDLLLLDAFCWFVTWYL